jgi:hypothetical protein
VAGGSPRTRDLMGAAEAFGRAVKELALLAHAARALL